MRKNGLLLLVLISSVWITTMAVHARDLTPAEERIVEAKRALETSPKSHGTYNRLALAYVQRARETADPAFYDEALEALESSFTHSPKNFTAQKLRVWVLLGQHEFSKALTEARALNRRAPDDVFVYGLLTDALVELGRYEEAEEAAQWMLDLRPGNVPGLTRGAYLRELFGDIDGALEWMQAAYDQTYFDEFENRSWTLTQMAHLELSRGRVEAADKLASAALELFPDYHYALRELALVRLAQGRAADAVALLAKRYELAPHPENLFELAEATRRDGREEEASSLYREFEQAALLESKKTDNANRELIFYLADEAGESEKALEIAEMEAKRRSDVFTLDAHAWALHRAGQSEEAWKRMTTALEPGIQRASFYYHAGSIASSLGEVEMSRQFFEKSLQLEPFSEFAGSMGDALSELSRLAAVSE